MENEKDIRKKTIAPPDGGWGWVVLFGSFVCYFIVDGWSYSFGVVFPTLLEYFEESRAKTALIAALLYGVPLLVSPVVCALTEAYGCRVVCMVGGLMTGASFVVSCFAWSVDFLCFSIGILSSFGLSMIYVPSIVIVTHYFEERRGLATGLAVTGSGLGAFAFPPLLEFLLQEFGWKQTFLLFGAICFHIIPAGALFRRPPMTFHLTSLEDQKETSATPRAAGHICNQPGDILIPRLHSRVTVPHSLSKSQSALDSESQQHTISLTNVSASVRHSANPEDQHQSLLHANLGGTDRCMSSPDLFFIEEETRRQNPAKKCCGNFWNEFRSLIVLMFDKSLAQHKSYFVYTACTFLLYLFVGMPYVYLMDKALLLGISEVKSAFLFSIIGIGRTLGQILLGLLSDLPQLNPIMIYGACISVAGVATLLAPVCFIYELLCSYSFVFGFFVSVTYSLQLMCLVKMVGLEKATNAFGLFQLVQGIATLLGTPIAGNHLILHCCLNSFELMHLTDSSISGWLFEATNSYDMSFYVAGAWIFLSGIALVPLPKLFVLVDSPNDE